MNLQRVGGMIAGTALLLASLTIQPVSATTSAFNAGDLIKGSGSTVYYFAPNGKRLVFPNEKTYFTWYRDFTGVKTIPDGQLAAIPLGGNVTYRPGYKMVKITTDPKVYVVDQGGVLRWTQTEQLANTLFGINWKNRIDDIPDAFFVNYRVGTPIQTATDYNPANIMTATANISQDKQFDETKVTITISGKANGFVPTSITVRKGTEITWTNSDLIAETVTGNGWDSGDIQPGQTYKRVFDATGSFDYKSKYYPGTMQGTINVVP